MEDQNDMEDEETYMYPDCRIDPANGYFDAPLLYEDMRSMDMLEIIGLGKHPRLALEESYKVSTHAWTILTSEHRMVGSFGIAGSDQENVGVPWLLGTHRMHLIKKSFLKHSREWIKRVFGDYEVLTNVVMERNELSMRWLKWLGASFHDCTIDGYKQFYIYK